MPEEAVASPAPMPSPDPTWCDGPRCRGWQAFTRLQMACDMARLNSSSSLCCQNEFCFGCCDSVANRNGKAEDWCEHWCVMPTLIAGSGWFCMASTDRISCSDRPPGS
jgi:hypothetical protein